MPRPRRTHTKSRMGCFECKRRRLKCGEQKPTCSGCVKHETACEYPILEPLGSLEATSRLVLVDSSGDGSSIASSSGPPLPVLHCARSPLANSLPATKEFGQFDRNDFALWHHFITSTAATMTALWEGEIPLLALSCDYLIHGIISMAALHLAHLNPDQRPEYELLSTHHQNIALPSFQAELSTMSTENCHQIFAFSLILMITHFAPSFSFEASLLYPEATLFKGLAGWIAWHHGCHAILSQARLHIVAGPFGPLLDGARKARLIFESITDIAEDENERSLKRLLHHITNTHRSIQNPTSMSADQEIDVYVRAINQLRKLLAASSQSQDALTCRTLALIWPVVILEAFDKLLSEMRPPALTIMAHYCLLLKMCEPCWFVTCGSPEMIETVQRMLDNEWTVYLEWPMQVFEIVPHSNSTTIEEN